MHKGLAAAPPSLANRMALSQELLKKSNPAAVAATLAANGKIISRILKTNIDPIHCSWNYLCDARRMTACNGTLHTAH